MSPAGPDPGGGGPPRSTAREAGAEVRCVEPEAPPVLRGRIHVVVGPPEEIDGLLRVLHTEILSLLDAHPGAEIADGVLAVPIRVEFREYSLRRELKGAFVGSWLVYLLQSSLLPLAQALEARACALPAESAPPGSTPSERPG